MEEEVISPDQAPLPRIEVDTNTYCDLPSKPRIRRDIVEQLQLVPGQRVIAFMPPDREDEWPGVICFDADQREDWQWSVELD